MDIRMDTFTIDGLDSTDLERILTALEYYIRDCEDDTELDDAKEIRILYHRIAAVVNK